MAQGDKLYGILNPRSVENQVKELKRKLERTQQRSSSSKSGGESRELSTGGTSPSGYTSKVPTPNPDDITITTSSVVTTGGFYVPALLVAIDPLFEKVRGFMGYNIRLIDNVTNEVRTVSVPAIETSAGITVPSPIKINDFLPVESGETDKDISLQVQVKSSLYGLSQWSNPMTVTASADITAPSTPSGLSIDGTKLSSIRVYWTACTDNDYDHTNVYAIYGGLLGSPITKFIGSVNGTSLSFPVDNQVDLGTITVTIEHVDTSGNISSQPTPVSVSLRKVNGDDLNSTVNYTGTFSVTSGGKLSAGGGNIIIDDTGINMTSAAGYLVIFYDIHGVEMGRFGNAGEVGVDAVIALISTNADMILGGENTTLTAGSELGLTAPDGILIQGTGSGVTPVTFDGPSSGAFPAVGFQINGANIARITKVGEFNTYDGTRWLGSPIRIDFAPRLLPPVSPATVTFGDAVIEADYGLKLVRFSAAIYVNGTNNGSNYWTITLLSDDGSSRTNLGSFNTSAVSGSAWHVLSLTSFSANNFAAGNQLVLNVDLGVTGAPGGLYISPAVRARYIV